ncbi:MAG: hypothetical protein Q9182_007426 [Xanthomendoza sp. 2 TL-2023]
MPKKKRIILKTPQTKVAKPQQKKKLTQRTPKDDVNRPPLPQCKGPKLNAFIDHEASIKFLRLLSAPHPDAQANVFEVLIGGKPYALKAFKYYDDEEDLFGLDDYELDKASRIHFDYYLDPFFNECRAYGKLIENNLNGEVAVHCHGYLMLTADYEDKLDDLFGELDWDRPDEEYEKPVSKRSPLRTIVKDLIVEDNIWKPYVVRKMLRDLKKIRELEIYVMDIKPENYKGSKLVDFSIAMTLPHFVFDIKPEFQLQQYMNEDLAAFDGMLRDQKVKTKQRAFPDLATIKKLRSYKDPF